MNDTDYARESDQRIDDVISQKDKGRSRGIEVHTEHGEPRDLEYALQRATDDWVDAGNACGQTTMDFRDACCKLLERNSELESMLRKVVSGDWSVTGVQEFLGDV